MNPSFRADIIDKARAHDPAAAASEYDSEWRQDISSFLTDADIDAAIDRGIRSRPFSYDFTYFAFADMSGGRNDASALAIAHWERARIVVDRLEVFDAPHDPSIVAARFAEVLSMYTLTLVRGDNYSGEWVAGAFAQHRISYIPADAVKSEIYVECLPLFAQGLIQLVDNAKLEAELRQLERRPGAGRDRIDHPKGGHDDAANAALGACWLVSRQSSIASGDGDNVTSCFTDYDPLSRPSFQARRVPRHQELLPANLRVLADEDFTSAVRDHSPM